MKRIQQLGLETTATTQELVTGFQAIIAPALKAGYALEEIPELATRAAQAMGAFQIPIQQMRTEIESLLSGNINRAQDLLVGYLNVTGKMIKDWKAQGVLVEEINKRLESFRYSSDAIANTWASLTSNSQKYFELISGSTSGLFDSMKSSVRELQSLMISMNKDIRRGYRAEGRFNISGWGKGNGNYSLLHSWCAEPHGWNFYRI